MRVLAPSSRHIRPPVSAVLLRARVAVPLQVAATHRPDSHRALLPQPGLAWFSPATADSPTAFARTGEIDRRTLEDVPKVQRSPPPKQRSATCETAWVTSTQAGTPKLVVSKRRHPELPFLVAASQIDSMRRRVGPSTFRTVVKFRGVRHL